MDFNADYVILAGLVALAAFVALKWRGRAAKKRGGGGGKSDDDLKVR